MGSAVTMLDRIQSWLAKDKLTVVAVDPVLLAQVTEQIFSRVMRTYDTSEWVDQGTIPGLIQQAISLLIASILYDRAYSETSEEENKYAIKLESMSEAITEGVMMGNISLSDAGAINSRVAPEAPLFFPEDVTGNQPVYDAQGYRVGDTESNDIKFRMSGRW